MAKAKMKKATAAQGTGKSAVKNAKAVKKVAPKAAVKNAAKPAPKPVVPKAVARKSSAPIAVGKVVVKPAVASKASKVPTSQSARQGEKTFVKPAQKIEKPMKKSKEAERKGVNVPAPIPTDVRPAKNQAGLRSSELEHYRDMLLAKRRELVGDMSSMESEALQRGGNSNLSNLPLHMADMGTDNYEQEFTLGLMEKDRNLLREINNALAKIQDGSYGICEGTAKPIAKPRLEAQPWARYSIDHARKLEQRMGR